MLVNEKLTSIVRKKYYQWSMATSTIQLLYNILQNNFMYVQQRKEMNTGLEQAKAE